MPDFEQRPAHEGLKATAFGVTVFVVLVYMFLSIVL